MIFEYALDPSVLFSWAANRRNYAEFMREYGLGTPRLISSFPKKRASKLRSYLLKNSPSENDSLQGRRHQEMVVKITESLILRDGQNITDASWNEITKTEHERAPFGVVVSSNEIDIDQNITPDNMYSPDSIWEHSRQSNFPRTLDGIFTELRDLLRLSTEKIVIVDAYGWSQDAINTIQHIINSIHEDRVNSKCPSITLYYKEKLGSNNTGIGSPPGCRVKQQIMEGLSSDCSDINLIVFELRETEGSDAFHNRCVLTEHGGIILGHGIGVSGNESHTDEAILMEANIYDKKWNQFVETNCFKVVSCS